MNTKRLKVFLTLILITIFIVLALPEFSFSIGNKTITYPSVGFSKIGIGADYGSLRKGQGIYPDQVYTGVINFEDKELSTEEKQTYLELLLSTIENRINAAKVNDIKVEGIVSDEEYRVSFHIPSYYERKEEYVKALLRRGDLALQYTAGGVDLPFNLTAENIRSISIAQNIKYKQTVQGQEGSPSQTQESSISGLNLKLYFNSDAKTEVLRLPSFVNYFQSVLNGEPYGANLLIDGEVTHDLVSDDSDFTLIRAIPRDIDNEKTRQDVAEIILTYFEQETPLDFNTVISDNVVSSAPAYNADGTTLIAVSAILGIGLLVIALIKQIGFSKAMAFSEMFMFTVLLTIAIIKFVQAPISAGFILGILILFTLNSILILWLLNSEDKDELVSNIGVTLMLSISTILGLLGIYVSGNIIGVFGQTIEILTAGLIALLISAYINFSFVINTFVLSKFSIKEFFGIRKKYE
ncbi:hypothetical protein KC669_00750 [Candidatus Dojkabacteria bacterium]|uniref:Uncharacterized protein n=1 Tax=Candidatus Dojkabacteria bacterium TaxID=2099670 RepID=A0A955L9C7_9BACT|nr:hypothetical protein [Candidatus Dojkabacteria bacterium]